LLLRRGFAAGHEGLVRRHACGGVGGAG